MTSWRTLGRFQDVKLVALTRIDYFQAFAGFSFRLLDASAFMVSTTFSGPITVSTNLTQSITLFFTNIHQTHHADLHDFQEFTTNHFTNDIQSIASIFLCPLFGSAPLLHLPGDPYSSDFLPPLLLPAVVQFFFLRLSESSSSTQSTLHRPSVTCVSNFWVLLFLVYRGLLVGYKI